MDKSYSFFGSENKTKIIYLLSEKPNLSAKQISELTNISYKNTYKILKELESKEIAFSKRLKYGLSLSFMEFLKNLIEKSYNTYSSNQFFRNRLDFFNVLFSLKGSEVLQKNIEKEVDEFLLKKLDEWYSKYYDLEEIEEKKILEIINSNGSNSKNILEVGSGTGRISEYLNENFNDVLSIDSCKKYIEYSKKKYQKYHFENISFEDFKTKEKFDVIIFGWIGFHYFSNPKEVLNKAKKLLSKNGILIIVDAYFESEYVQILQKIRPVNLEDSKKLKEKCNETCMEIFGNFKQEILKTKYTFNTIEEIIETFKIELCLEESHIWTKEDEINLKKYLLSKKNPQIINEGVTIVTLINSTI